MHEFVLHESQDDIFGNTFIYFIRTISRVYYILKCQAAHHVNVKNLILIQEFQKVLGRQTAQYLETSMLRIGICAAYNKTKRMQISQAPIFFSASLF